MISKLKIYYANALTGASKQYCEINILAREVIENEIPYVEVLRYKGVSDHTIANPILVYDHDIVDCVRACDCVVGNFTISSTGIGIEFAEAVLHGKPVLVLHHESVRISSLICGYAAQFPDLVTIRSFKGLVGEIAGLVREKIAKNPQLDAIGQFGDLARFCRRSPSSCR